MMVMTIIVRHVVMHQQTRHGVPTKRNVQWMYVTSQTMLVTYASATITN